MEQETPHLDIIIASTDVFNIDSLIEDNISKLSKKIGFEYTLEFQSEGWFLGASWRQNYRNITQNAIIVTHGGLYNNYRYFKAVKELSEIRQDLRFIVRMENDKRFDDFGNNNELFAFYQQLEADFDKMSEAHNAAFSPDCDNSGKCEEFNQEDEISDDQHSESFRYDITKPVIITHQSLPYYLCKRSFSDMLCYEPYFDSYLKCFVEHLRQQKQVLANDNAKSTQQ